MNAIDSHLNSVTDASMKGLLWDTRVVHGKHMIMVNNLVCLATLCVVMPQWVDNTVVCLFVWWISATTDN